MREKTLINDNWLFSETHDFENAEKIHIPHTWNAEDGQDGGGDYFRGERYYLRKFKKPELKEGEELYVEFEGVNSMAKVFINGHEVAHHEGGYSKFRANLTARLKEENELLVEASNAVTNHVYPEFADFTFYGGIYRDVYLVKVAKAHFDLDYLGGSGIQADPIVKDGKATLTVKMFHKEGEGRWTLLDKEGKEAAKGKEGETVEIENVHLWNGIPDPYLYVLRNELVVDGEVTDCIEEKIGFREFRIDPKKGFFLNGKSYPLRGVSRHQDRLGKGNAISKEDQDEDMA
nr:glycoside hydrolase family 2 protein [Bacilli bacterium]